MNNFEKVKSGQRDYESRTRPTITLTSPEGNEFEGHWIEDEKSVSRKVAEFDFPNVSDTLTQDLKGTSWKYPITFQLEGPDHDLEASRFEWALYESGQWLIMHPIDGPLSLQLTEASIRRSSVKDINVTEISSTWIKPLNVENIPTAEMLADYVREYDARLVEDSSKSWVDNILQKTEAGRGAVRDAMGRATAAVNRVTQPLRSLNLTLNDTFNEIHSNMQGLLADAVLDPISIAGSFNEMLRLPVLATNDIAQRMKYYNELADEILSELLPDPSRIGLIPTEVLLNQLFTAEFVILGIHGVRCMIPIYGSPKSRPDALHWIDVIRDRFLYESNSFESVRIVFDNNRIQFQYFDWQDTYSIAVRELGAVIKYMMEKLYSLAVELRIELNSAVPAIRACMEAYGMRDDFDELYDQFIDINELTPEEILMLPPGTVVVIYAR